MSHYARIWEMITKYTFEIDPPLFIHVKCVICNKLLMDSYEGPCGCNYCRNCVQTYLGNANKCCPGNGIDCRHTKLCMEKNVVKSNSTDRKISKLQVTCPSDGCDYTNDMLTVSEHVGMCDKSGTVCPYTVMGCTIGSMRRQELAAHLAMEITLHNTLLVNWARKLNDTGHVGRQPKTCQNHAKQHRETQATP